MWESKIETLQQGCVRVRGLVGSRSLTYGETVDLLTGSAAFREWFSQLFINAPFAAYCWETPPVMRSSLDREFEFVLVDVPALGHLRADPRPFAEQFAQCDPRTSVVAFSNLGGDAFLVVPLPAGAGSTYAHLASFLRSAPQRQCHALWEAVGAAIKKHVGNDPLWVSTAGLGVSWLHVRLDTCPKYYRFDEYRSGA
jgi:hypothetical protein